MASTNAGFCQGNMTWCHAVRGPNYHWVIDSYERIKLPVVPAVVEALQKAVAERAAVLEKQKTEGGKRLRIHMKVARAEDQAERKKWVKQQVVRHTYGHDDSGDEGDDDGNLVRDVAQLIGDADEITVVSGRRCRCGSTDHSRYRRQLANFVVLIPFYQGQKSERNYFVHKGESVLGKLQT